MRKFSWNALKHFWQIHLTVALCAAVATGVLAGALIVGDSVRGSLRSLTAERLGAIQHALLADHFFQPTILARQNTVPTILLNGTVGAPQAQTRASKVNVMGITEDFFTFWAGDPLPNLNKTPNQPFNAIVINEALQNELKVQIGDMLLVNVAQVADIHPEFLLGERDAAEAIQSLRLVVSDIIPTQNVGRFNLRAQQSLPFNVFIALPVLQKALGQIGQVNALFTAETEPISPNQLTLTLDALDLDIQVHEDYLDLQSRQYLLKPALSKNALAVATENGISTLPTLTYLANTISANDRMVPYSTIVALPTNSGEFSVPLAENEIILNTWTADDLGVKVGDEITVTYYSVKSEDYSVKGEEAYITETASFLLKAILPIEGIAADSGIIPEFPGIHDTADMSEWESPFPIDYTLIRGQDEAYWDEYGPTPKAFISLETGKRLWKNRFGDLTTIRLSGAQGSDIQATRTLFETEFLTRVQPEQIGFQFVSLQADGLQAATGATDFGMLFSSLSILIILAVAWLVELFFRIGVEQRSHEIGILQAVGYPLAKVRRRFFFEGGSVAGIGTLLGCLLAIGYAQLMIFGLHTWWLPAIGTPFIAFHASLWSLLIGIGVTMVVMLNAIRVAVARIGQTSTATLLAGGTDFDTADVKPKPQETKTAGGLISKITYLGLGILGGSHLVENGWSGLPYLIFLSAIILFIVYGPRKGEGSYARLTRLLFIAVGIIIGTLIVYFPLGQRIRETVFSWFEHPIVQFLLSTLSILGVGWLVFSSWLTSENVPKRFSRVRFALKNAARQPQRSKISVTTVSLACCIIVAVGANRHDAAPETEYAFVAEASLPLHHSLNTPDGRFELGFSDAASELLSASEIMPFRVLPGEDVSCLNLYQPQKPQILGASGAMLVKPPWQRLELSDLGEGKAPAIGDDNSLRWILHHDPDEDFLVQDEFGKPLLLDIETLQGSLFQSQLIISESNFTKYFPSQSGYQFFLIKTPPEVRAETAQILEKTLGDYGFDLTSASARLANYRSVENTYISTFQSLGGLGVLLGTLGLALVLFRNIIERRGELATLRAFGFSRRLLSRMLFLESCFLLTVGMLIGIVAGLVAIYATHGYFPASPWVSLTNTLLFIFGFGIIANAVAVAIALRSPLLATLKSD